MTRTLQISALTKTFGRGVRAHSALRNVSLRLDAGEMVALIGASGSGKSTLLRHVAGLEAADAGTGEGLIEVSGRCVQRGGRLHRGARAERADTSMIFQQFNLVSRMSVLGNVCLGLLGRVPAWRGSLGAFRHDEKLAAMDALERVGMARFAAQRASTLSGGQQQRVAIARALLQQAQLVLADEPIASLDPASSMRVMRALAELNAVGKTVLVSLHQVSYAIAFCPRTVAMRDGEVVYDGPSRALTRDFLVGLYGEDSDELMLDTPPADDVDDAGGAAARAAA